VPRGWKFRRTNGGVTAAKGFSAAGVPCGIKVRKNAPDLGLILSDRTCSVAGVFTTSSAAAAPVRWCREVVRRGAARALVVNSGNANACTGERGERDAAAMAIATAGELGLDPAEVCVCSTGIIGRPLPVEKVVAGIIDAAETLLPDEAAAHAFARAIMTTDTAEKTIAVRAVIGGKVVAVGGSAKGAGMICPDMATLLSFVTTDAAVSPAMLRRAVRFAADASFNRITVDGDTSTNDSLLVLANGAAGNRRIERAGAAFDQLAAALEFVCIHLAKMIVRDGEGATKFVEVRVRTAATQKDAATVARAVANSPLVKCAINGCDPNWGRIISAAASCGARFHPARAVLHIGGKLAFKKGLAARTPIADLEAAMKHKDIEIDLALGLGKADATVWTCDLSRGYVAINADYHT